MGTSPLPVKCFKFSFSPTLDTQGHYAARALYRASPFETRDIRLHRPLRGPMTADRFGSGVVTTWVNDLDCRDRESNLNLNLENALPTDKR